MGTLDPRYHDLLLTLHVTFTSILPVYCGTITGHRRGVCLKTRPQNRYSLFVYVMLTEYSLWQFSIALSQTHNFIFSDQGEPRCWCQRFSAKPDVLIPTLPGSVRTCSVIQCVARPLTTDVRCTGSMLANGILAMFLLISSDIFMLLRSVPSASK